MDDPVEKNSFLESAKAKGYDVLVMDGQLDNHYVNWYESKHKDARFVRVDSDVIDKLIQKDETLKMSLSEAQQEIMRPVFESQMPKDEKIHYNISFEAMAADAAPVVITQNEFMRRMKEMAAISGGGMSQFYSQMPDNFTIAVNGNNPIVIDILADVEKSYGDKLKTITKKIDAAVAEERRFDEVVKGKKEEELTPEEKSTREELSKKIVTPVSYTHLDVYKRQVLHYCVHKYGQKRVAQIVTFGTMAPKLAIRDVARVQKLALSESDRLAKLVPDKVTPDKKAGETPFDFCYKESPELAAERESPNQLIRNTLKYAEKLEGSIRQTGVHACGVIIGQDDLENFAPMAIAKDADLNVVEFEGKEVESVGLIKMDRCV